MEVILHYLAWTLILLVYIAILGGLIGIIYHLIAMGITPIMTGIPFLQTDASELIPILEEIKISPNMLMVDLGCGDGQLISDISKKTPLKTIGCEVNPLLVWRGKFLNWMFRRKNTSIFKAKIEEFHDWQDADITFIFLYPPAIARLEDYFRDHLKKGSYLISRAFPLSEEWKNKLVKEFPGKQFPYFLYKI